MMATMRRVLSLLISGAVIVTALRPSPIRWTGNSMQLRDATKTEDEVRNKMKLDREVPDLAASNAVPGSDKTDMATAQMLDAGNLDEAFIQSLKKKRSYLRIVLERVMQSVDDIQLSKRIKASNELERRNRLYVTSKIYPEQTKAETKEKIIVLGTGWGGHSFLKTIDATKYDVKVISPRNYFMFTPMLAASAVGTVEFRSICEPIRNVNPFVDYIEATAISVDPKRKAVSCQSIKCEGTACDITDFDVEYDHLLVAVGATTNTFGIKGVREHCQFLKQIEDAANLRKALAYCFERANLPSLSEDEVRSALSFVIVGAGPTGVEFTSELRDWLEVEGRRYYPKLLNYTKITLVEAGMDSPPSLYDDLTLPTLTPCTSLSHTHVSTRS